VTVSWVASGHTTFGLFGVLGSVAGMQKLRDMWIVAVAVVVTTAKRVTFMLTHLHTLK